MLRESTSASPSRTEPGLALATSRDASGRLWLHAVLVGEPEFDRESWARQVAGTVLQLAWQPSAAPRLCPLAPGLVLAAELAELGPRFAVNVSFAEAFGFPLAAPHLPCFVQLGCRSLPPSTSMLDPARFDDLPMLETLLGSVGADALLRAELATDPRGRLHELESALRNPGLRERTIDPPLLEAIVLACSIAETGKAIAWAHELLDRLDTHRHGLAVRLRDASGSMAALLLARLRLHEATGRALTGDDPRLAGMFAGAEGRSLLARRH